jgi:hypothetical protein
VVGGKPAEGSVCNAAEAAAGEKHLKTHPGDLRTRRRLLTWYLHRHKDPGMRDARVAQIAWMAEHHPELKLFDERAWIVDTRDREGFERVRTLWLRKARAFPENPQVLANAALALSLSDRRLAAAWMKKVIATHPADFPEMKWTLGMLYADAIMGVTSRTPYYAPGPADRTASNSPFAREALAEARRSKDAVLVYHVGWHLHLTSDALCRPDYGEMAAELIGRAAGLATETYQTEAYRISLKTVRRAMEVRRRGCPAAGGPLFASEPDGLIANGLCTAAAVAGR